MTIVAEHAFKGQDICQRKQAFNRHLADVISIQESSLPPVGDKLFEPEEQSA